MSRPLLLILALSALLALGYAWATPLGAAPDEGAHLKYVQVLAKEGRLPRLNLAQRRNSLADPDYESHQPPLYYALAVPFYALGKLAGGEAIGGQACRALSILIGLAGTVLVWLLARELAPERSALWLSAAGLAAFLPMRLSIIASVSNDALAEATNSLALLLMLRALRGPWGVRQAAWLGVALGAALLTKQNAVLLLPPALLAIFLASKRTGETPRSPSVRIPGSPKRRGEPPEHRNRSSPFPRKEGLPPVRGGGRGVRSPASEADWAPMFVRTGLVLAGVTLLLSGWWFARNQVLYGDPLAKRAFDWYFEDTPRWENFRDMGWTFGRYLGLKVLPTTFDSFWGAFGYLDPTRPDLFLGAYGEGPPGPRWGYPPRSWIYPLLLLAVFLSVAGGLRYYLKWRETWGAADQASGSAAGVGVLALHAVFQVAALMNFNATYFQAQGRYLFPAIGVLALGLAGGWLEWARKRETVAAWGVVTAVLILALYALFGVLLPGFQAA
jgi:hypothetical protein